MPASAIRRWPTLADAGRRWPTLADAILDRLVHNSYRLKLAGDSMRKRKNKAPAATTAD